MCLRTNAIPILRIFHFPASPKILRSFFRKLHLKSAAKQQIGEAGSPVGDLHAAGGNLPGISCAAHTLGVPRGEQPLGRAPRLGTSGTFLVLFWCQKRTTPSYKRRPRLARERLFSAYFCVCGYFSTTLPFSSASTVRLPPEASVPSMMRSAAGSSTALRMVRRRSRAPNLPPSLRATSALRAAGV